ncbi:TRAP transporter small permease [Rhodobacteraceae bacterium RKSG542]|uniref:TRAP transporter small permease n=1 Tax=Pseudovibrio flavus TaxID=2529854 RepID=UPI0012BD639B|nr:TRAP transporter small permease [Pseudovibrio flavus]MTI15975.1 TRAP transporter small permease [Pseudovibrio flavus]
MRFLKLLDENFERWFIAWAMGSMVVLIGLQVFMRYVLQNSLVWSEEFVRWTFLWCIWIGIAYAFKVRAHINITVLVDLLPKRSAMIVALIVNVVMIVFFFWITYLGYKQATMPFIMRQTSVVLEWPLIGGRVSVIWMYATLPFGALLSAYRLIQVTAEDVKSLKAMKGTD